MPLTVVKTLTSKERHFQWQESDWTESCNGKRRLSRKKFTVKWHSPWQAKFDPLLLSCRIPESKRHKNRGVGRGKRPTTKAKREVKAEVGDGEEPSPKKRRKRAEVPPSQMPKDIVCDQCGFATTHNSKLERHINRVHLDIRYVTTNWRVSKMKICHPHTI